MKLTSETATVFTKNQHVTVSRINRAEKINLKLRASANDVKIESISPYKSDTFAPAVFSNLNS